MNEFEKELKSLPTKDLLLMMQDYGDLYPEEELAILRREIDLRVQEENREDIEKAAKKAQEEAEKEKTVDYNDRSVFSLASGKDYQYVVIQVTLKEKFFGTGSGNLVELEKCINDQASKGYRLHTITTSNGGSKGLMGGDRIQATLVFEKVL